MVWLWERGKHEPRTQTLERLATALGCSVGDFFEENGSDAR
jgi:transcriptional regulator with XRE-family HTH domain